MRDFRHVTSSLVKGVSLQTLRISRHIGKENDAGGSCLLMPPHGPGSLGDEAIIMAAATQLENRGAGKVGIIEFDINRRWMDRITVDSSIDMVHYFQYGGSRREFRLISFLRSYDNFYFLGTDVIDGYYSEERSLRRIRLLHLAGQAGRKSYLTNFSFNRLPTPKVIAALRNLPESTIFRSRDPLSRDRISEVLDREVEVTSDIAFMVRPNASSQMVKGIKGWIMQERSIGQIVLGVNFNSLLVTGLDGRGRENIVSRCAGLLKSLIDGIKNISLLFIAHDFREDSSDSDLLQAIELALPMEARNHTYQPPGQYGAAEVKAMCGYLDFVISGRMHLAIASLGQGVPVVCASYQDKMEGLFCHFGLEDMTFILDSNTDYSKISEFIIDNIQNRERLQGTIRRELPRIMKLAERNMA